MVLSDQKRAKRVAKLDKLHRKLADTVANMDKYRWSQAVHAANAVKCKRLLAKETAAARTMAKLRTKMLQKCGDPVDLFDVDQVVWQTAKYGLLPALKTLVRANVALLDVPVGDSLETPLLVAAANGHLDCVQFLVQMKADTHAVDASGRSVLHVAAHHHHTDIVSFLLTLPSMSPFARDHAHSSPLDLARQGALANGDKYGAYAATIRALEAKTTAMSGWLLESLRDTSLNKYLLSPLGLTSHSWKLRFAVALFTVTPGVIEVLLYDAAPNSSILPAIPEHSIQFDGGLVAVPGSHCTMNNESHTFSISGRHNLSTLDTTFDFAVKSTQDHAAWVAFFQQIGRHSVRFPPPDDDDPAALFPMPIHSGTAPPQMGLHTASSDDSTSNEASPIDAIPVAISVKGVDDEMEPIALQLPSAAPDESAASAEECVVCLDRAQEAVCVPCGHKATCMDCATALMSLVVTACPICRAEVREVVRLYVC